MSATAVQALLKVPGMLLLLALLTLVCATNSLRGDTLLRRSHICSVGLRSSSEATISWVAMSGFHWRAEQRRWLQVASMGHQHKGRQGQQEGVAAS